MKEAKSSDIYGSELDQEIEGGQSRSVITPPRTTAKRGGKRPGTGGSKSILEGGKTRKDPDMGWPTCYGPKCDAPAKKIAVTPTEEGSYDLSPVCHSCAQKGKKKGLVSRSLTTAGLEAFKKYDEMGHTPGSIHGERKRVVEEPSGRKRVRENRLSTSPQTKMMALESRIREADPSGPTGTSFYVPSKTASGLTRISPSDSEGQPVPKPAGWYTVKERETPVVGSDPTMVTKGSGEIQNLYKERHMEAVRRRRTPEQRAALLSNFLKKDNG